MLIGELSEMSGLSRDTIRYYEKLGLLQVPFRNADNAYKLYDRTSLLRLEQVQRLKALGFFPA